MTDDRSARVRAYLLSRAERHDWRELWPLVTQARLDLLEAIDGIMEEQASWRPAPDEWSIAECARHLLTSSRNNRRRIEGLLRGEQPGENPPASPGPDETAIEEVRTGLIDDGARFGALVTQVPDNLDLSVRVEHRMFGPLNAREWFLFQRLHDTDHAAQIRAVREREGFPAASGTAS